MSMIRVLIADDHKMVREGLRRILEFDGEIQVIDEADNGEECIKKIRSSKPDIVLLDINMPVMNGIEALQEIRKKKLKTKVIILTVHNEIEYLLRAVDIGIDGYVLKDSDVISALPPPGACILLAFSPTTRSFLIFLESRGSSFLSFFKRTTDSSAVRLSDSLSR